MSGRSPARTALAWLLLAGVALVVIVHALPSDDDDAERRPDLIGGPVEVPTDTGAASFGPLLGSDAPTALPHQAGPALAGRPVPTNQWWTSALVGPGTQVLWAQPIAVRVTDAGIDIAAPRPEARADAVVAPFIANLRLEATPNRTEVTDFGHFDVGLGIDTEDGGRLRVRLAQGSPATWIESDGADLDLELHPSASAESGEQHGHVRILGPLGEWDMFVDADSVFVSGRRIALTNLARLTLVATPIEAASDWPESARQLATTPVETTRHAMATVEDGRVRQDLTWLPLGDRPVALLPHQMGQLTDARGRSLGHYPTPRGDLTVVATSGAVAWETRARPMLFGVPALDLGPAARSAALERLADDADATQIAGGSYFGSKSLARLASLVDIARRLDEDLAEELTLELTRELVSRLDHAEEGDGHWLAFDPNWGGIIATPAEFGSNDYNDHHFHYGYLIHAAAVIAERDSAFVADYGPMVELLISDVIGDPGGSSFASLSNFNPYLGHSYASGFAPFADGNNQESSSEAVNFWWALARWAAATDQPALLSTARAHHTVEATTASLYWLGEGHRRPAGYAHDVAGIVWDGKIDFATFFDPHPSKVIGIQLLPFTFGSLYRSDPVAAEARSAASVVSEWPDLTAMDLALADPRGSLDRVGLLDASQIEGGNSRSFAHWWITTLADHGHPDDSVVTDTGFGAAFTSGGRRTLIGVNPTSTPISVDFVVPENERHRLELEPGEASIVELK